MAEYVALSGGQGEEAEPVDSKAKRRRIASLDVFRGLSIALMIFVDYAGSIFPFVAHSPWHGVRLADFVTPFFLFIAGISLSLVYKKTSNKLQATQQAVLRALELFLLGILLQGGYFHGVNSLSFGIDVEKIRWSGILQRIAVGYVIAAVCEIWLSNTPRNAGHVGVFFRNYFLHWELHRLQSYGLPTWTAKESRGLPSWTAGLPALLKLYIRYSLMPTWSGY